MIGYHIARELASLTSATIIAHRRDAAALRAALPDQRLRFVGSPRLAATLRWISARLFPGRWNLISVMDLPDYLLFDLAAFVVARRELRAQPVDYVLRVNPVSFRFPSLLPRLPVPVFTGPHNGGMQWPPGFAHLNRREHSAARLRGASDLLHRLFRDGPRYAGVFAAHEGCTDTVPPVGRDR